MDDLIEISEIFLIKNDDALNSLSALRGLTKIGKQFYIFDNLRLTSLNGLENLVEVPQLLITNNINLTNIGALGGITSSAEIKIDSNDSLVNFFSLTRLVQVNSDSIYFLARFNSYNPTLENLANNNCSN